MQPPNAPGASPGDWSYLAGLGLTEDLLPVVSDTSAPISPRSAIKDVGKTPSVLTADGVVGIAKWTQQRTSAGQVAQWSRDGRLGICIQTRRVRAIDVDIADPVISAAVRDLVVMLLGDLPCRWRTNSGKLLLAFDMPGEFTKRIIRAEAGLIEFLATGQQFIAHGTHTSGVRYRWDGLDACAVLGGFPVVEPSAFEALWEGLADIYGPSVEARAGQAPTEARRAVDSDDPVVQHLEAGGWVVGQGSNGLVHVTCPWKAEHTSDSGPSESSWLPAGVGGIGAGHFKCLHAHCARRSDDEFLEAVGYTEAAFDVVEAAPPAPGASVALPEPVFERDKAGRILSTATNAQRALQRPDVVGYRLGYDEFMGRRVIAVAGAQAWRPFKDSDYFELRVQLERVGFLKPGQDLVREAVRCVAEHEAFDSATLWGQALQWDGVPRVERFFQRYLGVRDTAYHRAVGVYLWTALAGRCMDPGCKVDMVPVLIGAQGSGKTSMVEALAPTEEAFIEVNLDQRNEEQMARSLRGKLVGELAELRGLAGREAEDIKAWISRRHEEIRALYAEFHTKYPRRLVLIGTGNNPEFLSDDTGERRWLPLRVGATDLDALRRDRDQLWAEGIAMWRAGGVQWREAQALAVEHHAAFKVSDPWAEAIAHWLAEEDLAGVANGATRFSARAVLVSALRFADSSIKKSDEMRVAKVLRSLGFEKVERWEQGKNSKKWERAVFSVQEIA